MVTAISTVIMFLLMVSLHEFGHFIVGKLTGMEIKEYAIGMGPAIFKKQGKETLYSVRILPIGGYCAFEGEDEESDNPRAFSNQSTWKKIAVVIAGSVMNIILGFVIFSVISINSAPFVTNEIASLDQRAYMYQQGVMPGDRIVGINGHGINFYRDIKLYSDELSPDENVNITLKRNGEKFKISIPLSLCESEIIYGENGATRKTLVNGVLEEEHLEYKEGYEVPKEYIGKSVKETSYLMGFSPKTEELSFFGVIEDAWYNTLFAVRLVYTSLRDMLTGKVGLEQVSGPVGVVDTVNTVVKSGGGILSILSIAALLTINLGIFNLLPIPALDGGRLLFLLYELIFRKKVPQDKEGLVHMIGFILLMLIAVVVLFKDVFMIITR